MKDEYYTVELLQNFQCGDAWKIYRYYKIKAGNFPKHCPLMADMVDFLAGRKIVKISVATKFCDEEVKKKDKSNVLTIDKEKHKRSDESNQRNRISELKDAIRIRSKVPGVFEPEFYEYFSSIPNASTMSIDWKQMPLELYDARDMKAFNKLDVTQKRLFFRYHGLFVAMIDKRSTDCLWKFGQISHVYGTVAWFKILLCLANVKSSSSKSNACYYKNDSKYRPKIDLRMGSGLYNGRDKTSFDLQIFCSLLNRNTTESDEADIYGSRYTASHTCNTKKCVRIDHVKRQTHDENRTAYLNMIQE